MIEISSLKQEDIERLKLSCSSFFLSYNKNNRFKPQYNELISLFGESYCKEVWTIITCCTRTIRQGNSKSTFSLNYNHYAQVSKDKGIKISYPRMKEVLYKLEDEGYIKIYLGGYNNNERYTTVIYFEDKFTIMFDRAIVNLSVRLFDDEDLILVRDDKKNPITGKLFRGIKVLRNELKEYNKLLSTVNIEVLDQKCGVQYRRVFTSDLKGGGRYYSGVFQTLKSRYRKGITFNQEPTVELDISSVHPAIIACKSHVVLPDGYKVYETYSKDVDFKDQWRALHKQATICMLYSASNAEARGSLYNHYIENKDEDYPDIEVDERKVTEVMRSIVSKNPFLKSFTYKKDSWKELQYTDSEICRRVINKFVSLGKPILSYHDSFIVVESDKELLIETMKDAWYEVLGTNDNLSIK